MVNHYHKVLEEAAKKKIAINAHEPIKATGKRRTYPNAVAQRRVKRSGVQCLVGRRRKSTKSFTHSGFYKNAFRSYRFHSWRF
jgi:hypothetical protein